jgi:hypothetical protein
MDDLAAFISARLSEDEAAAKAATARQPYDEWDAVGAGGEDDVALSNWRVVAIAIPGLKPEHSPAARAVMRHIARHDPARVLREVAARRLMAKLHDRVHTCPVIVPVANPSAFAEGMYVSDEYIDGDDPEVSPCTTLRAIAATWSDHPDYRAEWAPGHG